MNERSMPEFQKSGKQLWKDFSVTLNVSMFFIKHSVQIGTGDKTGRNKEVTGN